MSTEQRQVSYRIMLVTKDECDVSEKNTFYWLLYLAAYLFDLPDSRSQLVNRL